MRDRIRFQTKIHFSCGANGRKRLEAGEPPPPPPAAGRVPRISRLMALAIRFDALIRDGAVADQAELARLGHVTRARVTQIMNLLMLAPDIQEELLHLPRIAAGRDPIHERHLRPIAAVPRLAQAAADVERLQVLPLTRVAVGRETRPLVRM